MTVEAPPTTHICRLSSLGSRLWDGVLCVSNLLRRSVRINTSRVLNEARCGRGKSWAARVPQRRPKLIPLKEEWPCRVVLSCLELEQRTKPFHHSINQSKHAGCPWEGGVIFDEEALFSWGQCELLGILASTAEGTLASVLRLTGACRVYHRPHLAALHVDSPASYKGVLLSSKCEYSLSWKVCTPTWVKSSTFWFIHQFSLAWWAWVLSR